MELGIPQDFKLHAKGLFLQSTSWPIDMMNIPKAHELGVSGKGVKIAILDTGVNYSHDDLPVPFETWKGIPFESDNDGHGHGTGTLYCASLVAPNAEYFVGKVMYDSGSGDRNSLSEGVYAAIRAGCEVISMSIGGPAELDYRELNKALKFAHDSNVIVVVSSGNSGTSVGYPARLPFVVSVGAIDINKAPAIFQNFGAELDVVGPGVRIWVKWINDTVETVDGTSFSCPFVAGLVALIIQDWRNKYGDYDVSEILRVLYTNCEDLNIPGWDNRAGHGLPIATEGGPFKTDRQLGQIKVCPPKSDFKFIRKIIKWLRNL